MKKRISQMGEYPSRNRESQSGFTLIEMMLVVLIVVVLAGISVPKFANFLHNARLQGAASDLSGLLQQARIRAVQDDTYYSTYIITSGTIREAYVDLKSNGGTGEDTLDPVIAINKEVTLAAASGVPSTSNLKGQFLPVGSTLTVNDGNSSITPVIFSPRGLPCATMAVTGGTICNSAGGATPFWIFFQDSSTQQYQAVTISPAGRIQNWTLQGTVWVKD
jgi:prepilin-type N-terminal cleavage/methylation domain-containing protein